MAPSKPDRRRLDYGTLSPWSTRRSSPQDTERLAENCEKAGERARAFSVSSRRSASIMHRSLTYWSSGGNRPDIAGLYAEQVRLYGEVADRYDELAVNADLLAATLRGGASRG
jgi:hypothetical protein